MKKLLFFLSALLCFGMLTSCKDKKAPETKQKKESMFTKADTTRVFELVEQFTNCLQNNDIKGAVDMLVFLDGDTLKPLSAANVQRQSNALRFIAGKTGYTLDRVVMEDTKRNEAKIDIILFEKPEGDTRPNTTSFYLRPVYIDGDWHLTTRDNITNTVREKPVESDVVVLDSDEGNE